ncbi:hypothetical protein C1646_761498 [Rhizophagus diaphanus]|nr:hypothetical protein C1646_761498 [Rhizophagus diaphanus] [Rhizophagus sp. MUCL 43196]
MMMTFLLQSSNSFDKAYFVDMNDKFWLQTDKSIDGGMLRMIDIDMNIDCEGKEEGHDLDLDQEVDQEVEIEDEIEVEIEDEIEVEIEDEIEKLLEDFYLPFYENISNKKCQIIKIGPSELCHVKIKVECEKISSKKLFPPAITATVKEYAIIELDLGASAQELKRKKVTNIKYKVCGPMEVHFIDNSDLKLDISQSVSYLKEQGYQVEIYHVHQRSTKGIVFSNLRNLRIMDG